LSKILLERFVLHDAELTQDFRMRFLAHGDFLGFTDQNQLAITGNGILDAGREQKTDSN
jgi:hypothetical protein